jgi:outer membrane protein assembly factor BamB
MSRKRGARPQIGVSRLAGAATLAGLLCASTAALAADVLTYHNSNQRHGAYVAPALTQAAAAGIHFDTSFNSSYSGNVYAQPLFWHPKGGKPMVIVATESNSVVALDAATGATLWTAQLPASVPLGDLPCGNINPEGITGTPVIDPASGTLYLDALTLVNNAPTHELFALSLANKGQVLPGWPVSVDALAAGAGQTFTSDTQGNRSGALIFDGDIYFSYAGRSGDCGTYHGTVVQIDPSNQSLAGFWQTRAHGGGIWAQGGTSSDGKSLFVTTGNTMNADNNWQDGEAILRLKPGLAHSTNTADYFAPSNWQDLDNSDADLGGTEAIPLNVSGGGKHGAARVIAFGKDGNAYLVNRVKLGGIGGQIETLSVSNSVIITAPAVYSTADTTMVAFTNYAGKSCSSNDITMLNIAPTGTSPITTAWCADFNGKGAPIVTTTDGTSNPIVWVAGAEGDNELHAFNATTGAVLFSGSGTGMSGLHHFQTLISAEGRLYVAGDNKVYAFTY